MHHISPQLPGSYYIIASGQLTQVLDIQTPNRKRKRVKILLKISQQSFKKFSPDIYI